MAQPARLLGPLEAAATRISPVRYVCSTCRRQFLPYRSQTVVYATRRHNTSDSRNWTDRLRQKIRGKEERPGPQSPYGAGNKIEESARDRWEEYSPENQEKEEEKEDEGQRVTTDAEYTPATTWDGLRRVGFEKKWWELEETSNVDFEPFVPSLKLQSRDELVHALRRTLVEITMMERVQRPMDDICKPHEEHHLDLLDQVKVMPSKEGSPAKLVFPDVEAEKQLFQIFGQLGYEDDATHSPEGGQRETATPLLEDHDHENRTATQSPAGDESKTQAITESEFAAEPDLDFLSLSLESSLSLKFAFLKRTSQLTGHRVPDCDISTITSPSDLLQFMLDTDKRKQKKVAEDLMEMTELTSLSNVKISDKKSDFVQQETEIGRWKLIEAELSKRDLPLEVNMQKPWQRKNQSS